MRLLLLASHPVAQGACQALLQVATVTGVGVPADRAEPWLSWARATGAPLLLLEPGPWRQQLRDHGARHGPAAALVMTFPWRIPAALRRTVPGGFINCHLGPLPEWRGPDSPFWLIRAGAAEGGVTVMQMDDDWDTGPVARFFPLALQSTDTHGIHVARLGSVLTEAATWTAKALQDDALTFRPQTTLAAATQPRPGEDDLRLNWRKPAVELERLVRAANPDHGGARTTFSEARLLVWEAQVLPAPGTVPPGQLLRIASQGPVVSTGRDALALTVVQTAHGLYGGVRFAEVYGLKPGEKFA